MEKLVKGNIVVIPFPFSDLSSSKKRPALVLANLEGEDCILAQITSSSRQNKYTIPIQERDCKEGVLNQESQIRTDKLFTANRILVEYKLGSINAEKQKEVEQKIIEIFTK